MSPDDARVWLTYYGAIAGGGITITGVAWTIHNQRKYEKKRDLERKEEITIQYRPIIVFKRYKQQAQETYVIIEEKDENFIVRICLYNFGRGEGTCVKIHILDTLGQYKELHAYSIIVSNGHVQSTLKIPRNFKESQQGEKLSLNFMCSYQPLDNAYSSNTFFSRFDMSVPSDIANTALFMMLLLFFVPLIFVGTLMASGATT